MKVEMYVVIKKDGGRKNFPGFITKGQILVNHKGFPCFSKSLLEKQGLLEEAIKLRNDISIDDISDALKKCIYRLGENEDGSIVISHEKYAVDYLKKAGYTVEIDTLQARKERKENYERKKKDKIEQDERERTERKALYDALMEKITKNLISTTLYDETKDYESLGFKEIEKHRGLGGLANWGDNNSGKVYVFVHPDTQERVILEYYGNAHRTFVEKKRYNRMLQSAIKHSVKNPSSYLLETLLDIWDYSDCYASEHYKIIKKDKKLIKEIIENYKKRKLRAELSEDEKKYPHTPAFGWCNGENRIWEKLGIKEEVERLGKERNEKQQEIINTEKRR